MLSSKNRECKKKVVGRALRPGRPGGSGPEGGPGLRPRGSVARAGRPWALTGGGGVQDLGRRGPRQPAVSDSGSGHQRHGGNDSEAAAAVTVTNDIFNLSLGSFPSSDTGREVRGQRCKAP